MRKKITIIMMVAAVALCTAATTTTINLQAKHQIVTGFGASDCWLGDYVGRYFNDTMRERAAKLLFARSFNRGGNPEGIGLSLWRVNLGAGSAAQGDDSGIEDVYRRADSYLATNGTSYDWSRCTGQRWLMQKATEYGVESILLFSNSPLVQYTKNGKAFNSSLLNTNANLKSDCYDDFAGYMATVAKHFVDMGYPIRYISPVNEPQYDWTSSSNQEGSPWQNDEIALLVRQLNSALDSRSLATQILIPEAAEWQYLTGGWSIIHTHATNQLDAFFSPGSTAYVGNLPHVAPVAAAHSYWSFTTNNALTSARTTAAQGAASHGVGLVQSEWSMLDAAPSASAGFPEGGYDEATYMDIALYMAKVIYCDLVYAGVSSWSYWTAFAQERWGQKNRFYLLRVNAAGDTGTESYGDLKNGGTIVDNRNLWVLGNYSRFIRPGYQRVGLTGADDLNGLMGSAYVSPDGLEAVVVYVNMAQSNQSVTLSITDSNKQVAGVKKYTTSSALALNYDRNLPYDYTGEAIEIPARSVVTLVVDLANDCQTCDVNCDGAVDVSDVNIVINVMLGKDSNATHMSRADVSGDGAIDVTDINIVINTMLGKTHQQK